MNALTKPIGTAASIAFTAICIAALLAVLALCQHYYFADLPNASGDVRQTGHDPAKPSSEAAIFGFQILEPVMLELTSDNTSRRECASSRLYAEDDTTPATFLFEAVLDSFLR
jgi:hypothetical protein